MEKPDVTSLLHAAKSGDDDALNRLVSALYPELKAIAQRRARQSSAIGATTLVNEAFVRMLSRGKLMSKDRQQFFGLAATVMRRVVIDEVRYLTAEKRLGDSQTFVDSVMGDDAHERAQFVLEVDDVLEILNTEDPRAVRVFECRYFAGLTTEETAQSLSLSVRSVERSWAAARNRLAELLSRDTHTKEND